MGLNINRILEGAQTSRSSEQDKKDQERGAENTRRCKEVFPQGFSTVPKGFEVAVQDARFPSVQSITVLPTPSGNSLNVVLNGRVSRGGKEMRTNDTYTINREGNIQAGSSQINLPGVNLQDLFAFVLQKSIELKAGSRWVVTSLNIEPIGEKEEEPETNLPEPRGERTMTAGIDEVRVRNLSGIEGLLFRAVRRDKGLKGARLYVVRGEATDVAVLEHDQVRNAAYVVPLGGFFAAEPEQIGSMPDDEIDRLLLLLPGARALMLPPKERRTQPGVERIVHVGEWMGRLRQAVTKHAPNAFPAN